MDVGIDSILAASARALALDDKLAEAHASRGLAFHLANRADEAVAEFEQAIRLDGNSFEAHYFYARACIAQNNMHRAASLLERAVELKPNDYQMLAMLRLVYQTLGRTAEADAVARKVVEHAERELALHPDNPRPAYVGAGCLVTLGEHDRAREWLSRALALDPDDILTQYNVACVHAMLGETEPAFDLLERLLPLANQETKSWVRVDADLEALRPLPRYQKLLELIQ